MRPRNLEDLDGRGGNGIWMTSQLAAASDEAREAQPTFQSNRPRAS